MFFVLSANGVAVVPACPYLLVISSAGDTTYQSEAFASLSTNFLFAAIAKSFLTNASPHTFLSLNGILGNSFFIVSGFVNASSKIANTLSLSLPACLAAARAAGVIVPGLIFAKSLNTACDFLMSSM